MGDEGRSFLVNTLTLQKNDSFSKCNSGLVKERTWQLLLFYKSFRDIQQAHLST